jgi:nucleoside-diphosphate-sugar epimerase
MSWPTFLRTLRDNTPGAHNLSPFGIPSEPVALAAKAADFVGLGAMLPFDEGMARMGAEDSTAETTKAKRDLGFKPRPFAPSYAKYAAALAH